MDEKTKKIIKVILPIIIAFLSVFVIAKHTTSTEFHAKTIAALDENKKTVSELVAASTAASAAITIMPGDIATPIADKLADISSYFIVVICAIYLETYLLIITSYLTFYFLVPLGCVFLSVSTLWKKVAYWQTGIKLILVGVLIVSVVPASVKVSNLINGSYGESIQQTIAAAREATAEVEAQAKEDSETEEEKKGWLSGLVSTAKEKVTAATAEMEAMLNNMIDALALLIVTSCVIPILVILFFVWLAKAVLNIEQKKSFFEKTFSLQEKLPFEKNKKI